MSPSSIAAFRALFALATAGCAVRTDFIPATGERLSVVDEVRIVRGTEQVKVGETRDARGNVKEHFADRNYAEPQRFVNGVQGAKDIDDESFYRIAKDADAVATYDEYHASGKRASALGIGITAIAAGLVVSGIGLLSSSAVDGDPEPCKSCDGGINYPLNNLGVVSIAGIIVGGLGLIAGGNLWISGASRAGDRDARLYPIGETARRMKTDANAYNLQQKGGAR